MFTSRSDVPARSRLRFPRGRLAMILALAVALAAGGVQPLGAQTRNRLLVVQYQLVSQTAVAGGTEYVFRARLYNFGPAIPGAVARLTGVSDAASLVDDSLVFGAIGRNQAAWSTDTASVFRFGRWRDLLGDYRWNVTVNASNRPPTADAGLDQTVAAGAVATLDGSGSTDPDGDALAYAWQVVQAPAGSAATPDDPTAVRPGLTIDLPGIYVVSLTVRDTAGNQATDTVTLSTANTPPVARAGSDQTVVVGQIASLDGLGSSDADGDPLAYAWTLLSAPAGSAAALQNATSATPLLATDMPGDFVVQLVVSDGTAVSAADTVTVSTTNSAPVADAGTDPSPVVAGLPVTLDGSASADADGQPLTYAWSLLSVPAGSSAALTGASTVVTTFTPDVPGTYVAQLIVRDGFVASAPDTVSIDVLPAPPRVSTTATVPDAAEFGRAPGIVTVSRSGSRTLPLTVTLRVTGSAAEGVDYEPLGGPVFTVTIPAGEAFVDVAIVPRPDNLVEAPAEDVVVRVEPDATYLDDPLKAAVVTIADDPAVVSIVAADPSAAEFGPDGADTGRFDISRVGGDGAAPLVVTFDVAGTATPGADYTSLNGNPVTVVIPANVSTVSVFVVPLADVVADPNETVTANLTTSSSYVVGGTGTATITIR